MKKQQRIFLAMGLFVAAGLIYYVYARPALQTPVFGLAKAYFIDTETDEVTVLSDDFVPPLIGKAGNPTVVKAIYVSSDGGKTKKLAYLVKYSDKDKARMEESLKNKTALAPTSRLVKRPDKTSAWVSNGSPEGIQIMQFQPGANGLYPQIVIPPEELGFVRWVGCEWQRDFMVGLLRRFV